MTVQAPLAPIPHTVREPRRWRNTLAVKNFPIAAVGIVGVNLTLAAVQFLWGQWYIGLINIALAGGLLAIHRRSRPRRPRTITWEWEWEWATGARPLKVLSASPAAFPLAVMLGRTVLMDFGYEFPTDVLEARLSEHTDPLTATLLVSEAEEAYFAWRARRKLGPLGPVNKKVSA